MSSCTDFDVLIVGGGLVGATLAVALGQHLDLRVGLIEAQAIDEQSPQPLYDARSVALAHGTRLILAQLGIWPLIESDCQVIENIHISERGRFGVTRLNACEEGVPALGYVIENASLGRVLMHRLRQQDNVQLLSGREVIGLQQNTDSAVVRVRTAHRQSLRAKLVVAADGAHSALRTMAGIEVKQRDYQQVAVTTNVSTENPHNNIAYERFTDSGPLALLPLSGGRCSMVMTVSKKSKGDILSLDDAGFIAFLQQRFGQRLGRFTRVGRRSGFPLALISAQSGSVGRLLLIGNARHNLHAVSGQGFNLAMRDVGTLAQLLLSGRYQDPAAVALLQTFEQCRGSDHRVMEVFTDTLARLFTVPFKPLAHARGMGLIATDVLPFMHHTLARQSMGLRSPLPVLPSAPTHNL